MADFQPEAFGKYYLVDRIATGGMAEIFRARTFSHGGFQNLVAIKRILAHMSENAEFVEMFIDEAKVSAALQHEHIVRIYDFGKIAENWFIAMECVEGKDLRNLLKRLAQVKRFLPIELAALIAHDACKGLQHAHKRIDAEGRPYAIVHRDISPSNILVSYEGAVKIADFGIAKAESNAYQTRDGVLKGKFEYMSPEQVNGLDLDGRSDVFSVGILLWEMLSGRRLFKTDSDVQTLDRIRKGEIPRLSEVSSRVPEALEAIVFDALAIDRDQRFPDAATMQSDLANFLAPRSPDELRVELSKFMKELFAEEREVERMSLIRGTSIAQRMHADAPEGAWEDPTTHSTLKPPVTEPGVAARPGAGGWLAAVGALALLVAALLAVIGVGGALWWSSRAPESAPVAAPITAELVVSVEPAAALWLDDEPVGSSSLHRLRALSPGPHKLRFEAPDHEPATREIVVEAGDSLPISVVLRPKAPEVVPVAPDPSRTQVKPPKTKVEPPKDDPGDAAPAAPGALSVALIGGGWAHVWIDGEKVARTAPLSGLSLPAGRHVIRVANPEIGLDYTEPIVVGPGETVTVRARP